MTTPRPEQRLIELIVQTRLDQPDPQAVAELQVLLQDAKMRRLYVELIGLESQLETAHTQRTPGETSDQAVFSDVVTLLYADEGESSHAEASHTSTRKAYASALSYVLRHTFTPKRVVMLATAAAVLLGALLAMVFLIGDPDDPQPIADLPEQPEQTDEPISEPVVVATLTAERDAVWDRRPGEDLFAGQRLMLTQGFAELTTRRGAVAILEAPAVIELVNPNALHLHAGRMVGICETESSKGFVVRTPHMDITDLGTRFGVDATAAHQTEAHVIEGEVRVQATNATGNPVQLQKGEAARSSASGRSITRMAVDMQRFAALLPIEIELPGTGKGLAAGKPDPNWAVVEFQGQPVHPPYHPRVDNNPNYQRQFANDPDASQWLSWNHKPERPEGNYTRYLFQTTVVVPDTIDPSTASILLRQVADARVEAIVVNGQRIRLKLPAPGVNKTWRSSEVIDQHLVAGENTIGFEVLNHWKDNGTAGPVGLRVEWELRGYAP